MVHTRRTKKSSVSSVSPPSSPQALSIREAASTENSSKNTRRRSKSSPPTASSSIVSSPRTFRATERKNGLPLETKKQLLKDIESQGGIKTLSGRTHDLARLLDLKPDLYGVRGSNLRKSCRHFIRQAKEFKQDEYESRVLRPFGIESFLPLQQSKSISLTDVSEPKEVLLSSPHHSSNNKNPHQELDHFASPPSNVSHSVASSNNSTVSRLSPAVSLVNLNNQFQALGLITPEKSQLTLKKSSEKIASTTKPTSTMPVMNRLAITKNRQHDNGNYLVTNRTNIPGRGAWKTRAYSGVEVMIKVDTRFVMDEVLHSEYLQPGEGWYDGRLGPGKNQLTLFQPSVEYEVLKHPERFFQQIAVQSGLEAASNLERHNAIQTAKDNFQDKSKNSCIRREEVFTFDDGFVFSVKEIHDRQELAEKKKLLKSSTKIPVNVDYTDSSNAPQIGNGSEYYFIFTAARTDIDPIVTKSESKIRNPDANLLS